MPDHGNQSKQNILGGERRQITAFFYDLVGSTALIDEFGGEAMLEVQDFIHSCARKLVEQHGGTFGQERGDGGVAYFSLPLSREDSAVNAVRTGLTMISQCKNMPGQAKLSSPLRIGIATGEIILPDSEQSRLRGYGNVIGTAPNLASRLQEVATINTVLVCTKTHQLTKRVFDFGSPQTFSLKGFRDEIQCWNPLGEKDIVSRFAVSRDASLPLVSRERELYLLKNYARIALEQRPGQMVHISGEPGIGKSRLINDFAHSFYQPHEVKIFQCEPNASLDPLRPWKVHLSTHNTASMDDNAASLSPPTQLKELLFQSTPMAQTDVTQAMHKTRQKILQTLVKTLFHWEKEGLRLVVFEDVHWADELTREALYHLADQLHVSKLLILVNARPGSQFATNLPDNVHLLPLVRLASAEARRIAEAILSPLNLPDAIISQILKHSEGVPLFVEELSKYIAGHSANLTPEQYSGTIDIDQFTMYSVNEIVSARLDQHPQAREVALHASVIGRSFSLSLLQALMDSPSGNKDVQEHLDSLIRADIVLRLDDDNQPRYRFRHILIQQAAYGSLLKSSQRKLHSRLVDLLTTKPELDIETSDITIAFHCDQAGRRLDAIRHLLRSAKIASAQSALLEARQTLEKGMKLLSEVAEPGGVANLVETELELIASLGPIITTLEGTGSPAADKLYHRGISLCASLPVSKRNKWFDVYWGWWFTAKDFGVMSRRARVLLEDLVDVDDESVRLQALHCAWATSYNQGDHKSCVGAINAGMTLYDETIDLEQRTRFGGHDVRVCGLGQKAQSCWFMGHEQEAIHSIRLCRAWAEEIDHLGSLCHAMDMEGLIYIYSRRATDLARISRSLHELAEQQDLKAITAKANVFQAWSSFLKGNADMALIGIERGLEVLDELGTEEDVPIYTDMHAAIIAASGNIPRAIELVDGAIDYTRQLKHEFWQSELYRRKAMLLAQTDANSPDIVENLRKSLATAEEQSAIRLSIRTIACATELHPDMVMHYDAQKLHDWLHQIDRCDEWKIVKAFYDKHELGKGFER